MPPIVLDDAYIEAVRAGMAELPDDFRTKFSQMNIDPLVIEDIVAVPETAKLVSRIFEVAGAEHARRVAFWMMQPQTDDAAEETSEQTIDDEALVKLSELVAGDKLSSTAAKEVLAELLKSGGDPEQIAEAKNLLQVSDEGAILKIVKQVLAENQKAAADVKNGEMKAIGFLVGQVMKNSQGKANPALATELIKKELGI